MSLVQLISGETLRLLLVSARKEVRDEVGRALTNGGDEYRLYWVSQAELASTRVDDVAPHVILVDDVLSNVDPVALIGQLSSRAPSAAILALVEGNAMNLARQAMLAGARGFVTKPLETGDFLSTLRQVLSRQRRSDVGGSEAVETDGRIIVFCAPKGGTGRTTLTINTGISLHTATEQSVALVDADYASPAIDVALNLRSDRTVADLLSRMSRLDEEIISGVMLPHTSGVRVLLAPPPADLTSPMSLPQVQQVLVKLKRMYEWVLVDVGLPLDETAFGFLDGADRIVLSVLPEMVGLRNTRLMLEQLYDRGYPREKVWPVVNRATIQGGVSVDDIEKRLNVPIRFKIPDDQPLATHSINRGVPLVMSHRRSALARAFQKFAQELAGSFGYSTVRATASVTEGEDGALANLFGRLRRSLGSAEM